ncbi:MAG TPA: ABC transporter ATP-binding protein [bacterium]|nr:ABC transporter ATP-binding protein [bacterium]
MGVPAIRVQDLKYTFPDGTTALQGVSFTVEAGERVAVTGPNGAGKSTLLTLLNGLLAADGAVEIFGVPVIPANLPEIRRRVGLVFQDPDDQLFCPTIFDDIAFGPLNMGLEPVEVRGRVAKALAQVGLSGFEKRSAFHLSGGEKKRVSLATVLSMDVEILAMDEPSSNLDPRSRRLLIHWLRECDKTQIIATHDLDLAYELTGRTLILHGGKIVADGPTAEILTDQALLETHDLELPYQIQK